LPLGHSQVVIIDLPIRQCESSVDQTIPRAVKSAYGRLTNVCCHLVIQRVRVSELYLGEYGLESGHNLLIPLLRHQHQQWQIELIHKADELVRARPITLAARDIEIKT